jgi:hypothetical protein
MFTRLDGYLRGPTNINRIYQTIDAIDSFENNSKTKSLSIDYYDNVSYIYLSVYRSENLAIMSSYLTVGFALYFTRSPLSYYLVAQEDASTEIVGVLTTLLLLPWSFKIFFGLLSDSIPLLGYKRKPYMIIGDLMPINPIFISANSYLPTVR